MHKIKVEGSVNARVTQPFHTSQSSGILLVIGHVIRYLVTEALSVKNLVEAHVNLRRVDSAHPTE